MGGAGGASCVGICGECPDPSDIVDCSGECDPDDVANRCLSIESRCYTRWPFVVDLDPKRIYRTPNHPPLCDCSGSPAAWVSVNVGNSATKQRGLHHIIAPSPWAWSNLDLNDPCQLPADFVLTEYKCYELNISDEHLNWEMVLVTHDPHAPSASISFLEGGCPE